VSQPSDARAIPVAATARKTLLAVTPAELEAFVVERGGKPFHARIVRANVLEKGILEYAAMTSLSAGLRESLERELPIFAASEIDRSVAADATTKLLLEFERTNERDATVETVHMPSLYADEDPDGDRSGAREHDHADDREPDRGEHREHDRPGARRGATLCVSTQIGCPVGCPFCASGLLGLSRNLAAHEILEQYVRGRAIGPLARSVVMGMGEPLLNYENLSRALDAVHDEMKLGSRKVTVSTVGFPERLRKIAPAKPRFQLAISLHTPDQEQRDELVPAMKGVSIEEVLAAGDDWFEKTGREVTYEYILLGGENDTSGHARRLTERLRGRRCTLNLIPFNPVAESRYRRPSPRAIASFRDALTSARIVATVRWSRGVESDAACGQLRIRRLSHSE
jgi:23S rRNA (adenine2503-C2)-methyltransferase